ncbi:aminotransferase class III-fold pyridoxal phosphate-dependent enzyme [Thalassovita sp.]|uniref:aminotransferase class III-fold pyridoxal phosphate-dependent enzyme n=1 Tax=Thalassovita sp. TaxID=1979401 RepID=UPI002B275C1F|nr:aminotransferase class III-fold pyridoxal phosphate-dependent enzyme [Thalassovita sp.]
MKYLDSNPPRISQGDAIACLSNLFGKTGDAQDLYSDRDQNFLVTLEGGEKAILKVYNSGEAEQSVDFQTKALLHLEQHCRGVELPRIIPTTEGAAYGRLTAADGAQHLVRLISFVEGKLTDDFERTPALYRSLGAAVANLDLGLRGFYHPAAGAPLVWEMDAAMSLRDKTGFIKEAAARAQAEEVFARYVKDVRPRLQGLRSQIIHNDVTPVNSCVRPEAPERVSGIFDFGDMVFGALATEVATTAADSCLSGGDYLANIANVVSGYDEVLPLEEEEIDILFDLIRTRVANEYVIYSWRAAESKDRDNYLLAYEEPTRKALDGLMQIDLHEATKTLRDVCRFPDGAMPMTLPDGSPADGKIDTTLAEDRKELIARREHSYGDAHGLFYEDPLYLTGGRGVWLYDSEGRAYLDVYNNIPHIGHCHPHVANAVSRQVARLNTNSRYLYRPLVEYSERLTALLPDGLDRCFLFSSGSEANDFALRLARTYTGNKGAIVTRDAYHGVTDAVDGLSPLEQPDLTPTKPWARGVLPPCLYRTPFEGSEEEIVNAYLGNFDEALASLDEAGYGMSALVMDTGLTSSGVIDFPGNYLHETIRRTRAAGGLFIADEVQIGFGRTGSHFWRFDMYGVTPDIVTMGKPMGNGMPLSAVVTTEEIYQAFKKDNYLFSSTGGNPVSCAAGLAVLDVLERDNLQANAERVGAYIKRGLQDLQAKHDIIGDVRGRGLLLAVELVKDRATKEPVPGAVKAIINDMARNGVLIGSEGALGTVIKLRPPIVFSETNADLLLGAFSDALDRL